MKMKFMGITFKSLNWTKRKTRRFLKHVLVVLIIVAAVFFPLILDYQQINIYKLFNSNESDRYNQGVMGLEEYNFLRLRNPKTGKIPEGIFSKELKFAKTLPTAESIRHLNKLDKASTYNWKARGPFNVGGRTKAIGNDILDENIIIAGAATGGIWKSTDGGQSWIKKTRSEDLHSVMCVIQDIRAGKEHIWYSGTGEYIGTGGEKSRLIGNSPLGGDGIFKSTDNGETWNLLPSTSTGDPVNLDQDFDHVWYLAIDTTNYEQDEIYAAVYGSIYRSVDGGGTWERVLGGPNLANAYTDVKVSPTGVVYATLCWGSSMGVWRSEDGIDWTKISQASWPSYTRRVVIAIAPSNENVIYFLADLSTDWTNQSHKYWKYSFISGNGSGNGGDWDDRSANLPGDFNSQLSFCLVNTVHPTNENIVFIGGRKLYRSINGLQTSPILIGGTSMFPNDHVDQHSLIFSYQNPEVAYLGNDGGVSITQDVLTYPIQWSSLNNGYLTTQFYTVAIVPNRSQNSKIMGGLQDNGTYFTDNDNSSNDWEIISWGDGGFAAFLGIGYKMITSWQDGEIFISKLSYRDPNTNQLILTRINPNFTTPKIFFCPFVLDPNDDNIVYLGGSRIIYRCDSIKTIPFNGSQSTKSQYWTSMMTFLSGVSALGISKTSANILYAGTMNGEIYRIDNANSSPIRTQVYSGDAYISCIAVDQRNDDHVIATFSNYETKSVYSTINSGGIWTDVSGNLEEYPDGTGRGPSVRWVSILYEEGSNIYFVGTSTGLYSTNNLDGLNTVWAQEGPSIIGNVVVDMVVTRDVDGNVVVATHGNGIYSRDLPVSADENDIELIADFALYQNYPNPFNPTTNIEYGVPEESFLTVKVYDILGKEILTLVNDKKQPGYYSVQLDATGLSSGIYFYKLQAGEFVATKKMILMK